MPRFKVVVKATRIEIGETIIEAEDEDEAREIAKLPEMDDEFEWDGGSIEGVEVEIVEELEEGDDHA